MNPHAKEKEAALRAASDESHMITDSLHIPNRLPKDFVPTPPSGLTQEEAAQRLQAGLCNKSKADPGKSVWQIIASHLFTLFNLLNVFLAVCLALVGSYRNMLFLGVVVSNTLIGAVQELRAHRTIRRLQLLSASLCRVIREGKEQDCLADELVQGDLAVFRAGDQIPADALVIGGSGAANESLLTGESDPVSKKADDWLLSGSYVTEGKLIAQLVHVGDDSYVSRLNRAARHIKRPKSALMTDLNKLIRLVSCILLPLGAALFCKQFFLRHAPLEIAVPSTVAAMLGMIPEGLMLLTSVALAVGVVRLGRQNTLVQELYGIETLARADVLCLDKTGTLTTGDMTLNRLVPLDANENQLRAALSRFLGAFDQSSGTLDALRKAITPGSEQPCKVLPFSSKRKLSAAGFADGKTLILGAPSFVLGERFTGPVREKAERSAAEGLRVLVLCEADAPLSDGTLPPVSRILGLVVLEDTLRPHCAETLRYFREQDVQIKVISGDDPRTVAAVAIRAGLENADSWVDASTLRDDQALAQAAVRFTVFGRVTPDQKRRLVEALKAAGHSVAMTGDGVNDIPALKAADCSIAMAGGSDAAKHAAQLTLLDSDFSRMPQVVAEGRRVINNITRAASLFLVKTLYSFALSLLMLLLPAAYPFQPIQLTLISTLTIGTPSFFLALEPNHERVKGNFLRTVLTRALSGALGVTVCALLCMLLEHAGFSHGLCSTLATLSAGAMGLFVLLRVCLPLDRMRLALMLCMTAGMLLAVTLLGRMFFLEPLDPTHLLLLLALCAIGILVIQAVSFIISRRPAAKAPRSVNADR